MKFGTMRELLKIGEANGIDVTELRREFEMIELLSQAYCDDEDADVMLIAYNDVYELVNRCLYDTYGKINKAAGGCTLDQFILAAREDEYGFTHFTDEMLNAGYQFIVDLWDDNERDNSNNSDGTFKRY